MQLVRLAFAFEHEKHEKHERYPATLVRVLKDALRAPRIRSVLSVFSVVLPFRAFRVETSGLEAPMRGRSADALIWAALTYFARILRGRLLHRRREERGFDVGER